MKTEYKNAAESELEHPKAQPPFTIIWSLPVIFLDPRRGAHSLVYSHLNEFLNFYYTIQNLVLLRLFTE